MIRPSEKGRSLAMKQGEAGRIRGVLRLVA
jgi:hypothetical protein